MRGLVLIAALAALAACDGKVCDVGEARCDGLTAENCAEGYPGEIYWTHDDCADEGHCVIAEPGQALCALATSEDPLCIGPTEGLVCADGVQVQCELGYRVGETDCGAQELCREDLGYGVCLLLPDPDPLCDDVTGFDHACDGALNVTCFEGWRIEANDCGAPELCHVFDSGGTACVTSVDPDPRCEGITDNLDPAANYCEGDDHLICSVETGLMIIQPCAPGQVCGESEVYGRNTCYDPETGY